MNSHRTNTFYIKSVEDRCSELETIIDDLSEQIITMENRVKEYINIEKDKIDLYDLVYDFAHHGVRFDPRPTLVTINNKEETVNSLYEYIHKIDGSVRSKAKNVLAAIDARKDNVETV